jgi:hypothetical protein
MPKYNDGDSKNPDDISWFEDILYNNGDSDNPYPFNDSPASSVVKDSYHPNNISWFEDNSYDNEDIDNPYHFNDSPASSSVKDGYHNHLSVPGFITMDPHQDCADVIATPGCAPSLALLTSSRNFSQQLPSSSDIVLRISPAAGSAIFGSILIPENKCHQEKAISAYFENSGHEVTILPCPNFAEFLVDHSLQERNISLITNLPRYIIPAKIFILQANKYSALHNQEWLPAPPDLSSFNALSQHSLHRSSLSSRALLLCRNPHGNQLPDIAYLTIHLDDGLLAFTGKNLPPGLGIHM